MDEVLSEKIRTYFTDRIEEIKEGTYIPQYERFVNLPEFSGINRRTFKIARNKWYLQHFHITFDTFTTRLEKNKGGYISEKEYILNLKRERKLMDREIDIKRIKGKRNKGLGCCLIPGVLLTVIGFFAGVGSHWYGTVWPVLGFGIVVLVIGLALVLYHSKKLRLNTKKTNKGETQ